MTKSIFNENNLNYLINQKIEELFSSKIRPEMDKMWEHLNKLREEIKATQSLIEVINKR